MVVTDDHIFGRILRIMLKATGFETIQMVYGLADLRERQLGQHHDLIIVDDAGALPDEPDVLAHAASDSLFASALVVAVAPDASSRSKESCTRRGADAVLPRPTCPDELSRALIGLLSSRRSWRGKVVPHPASLPKRLSEIERRPRYVEDDLR